MRAFGRQVGVHQDSDTGLEDVGELGVEIALYLDPLGNGTERGELVMVVTTPSCLGLGCFALADRL